MITRIHVNQHHIKFNRKTPKKRKPVLTVKTYKSNIYTNEVKINGPSRIVYSPHKPLSCGAHVWIECDSGDIKYPQGQERYSDMKKNSDL